MDFSSSAPTVRELPSGDTVTQVEFDSGTDPVTDPSLTDLQTTAAGPIKLVSTTGTITVNDLVAAGGDGAPVHQVPHHPAGQVEPHQPHQVHLALGPARDAQVRVVALDRLEHRCGVEDLVEPEARAGRQRGAGRALYPLPSIHDSADP